MSSAEIVYRPVGLADGEGVQQVQLDLPEGTSDTVFRCWRGMSVRTIERRYPSDHLAVLFTGECQVDTFDFGVLLDHFENYEITNRPDIGLLAARFGPLGKHTHLHDFRRGAEGGVLERYADWMEELYSLKRALQILEVLQSGDESELRARFRFKDGWPARIVCDFPGDIEAGFNPYFSVEAKTLFPHFPEEIEEIQRTQDADAEAKVKALLVTVEPEYARAALRQELGLMIEKGLRGQIGLVHTRWKKSTDPAYTIKPSSLAGAMWLSLDQYARGLLVVSKCARKNCGRRFAPVGKKRSGRGMSYCSTACYQKAYQGNYKRKDRAKQS